MLTILSNSSASFYKHVAKPIIFKFSPEKVHDATLASATLAGSIAPLRGMVKAIWAYKNPTLEQNIDGNVYKNPIGLAAGWDKDAQAIRLMSSIGFGFAEVGSITQHAYAGNEGIRLWRLKKSQSIAVYYGLKNQGVDIIAPRIQATHSSIPVGTNIARTNSPDCDDESSIADYAYSFKKLAAIGNYFTINVSCPNTFGGQPFHDKKRLAALLTALDAIPTKKPVYIKISPDISFAERKAIAELSFKHRVNGFICGNLTKNRTLKGIKDTEVPAVGGLSGKVVEPLANELISDMYQLTKGGKTIIGLGGVFTGADAYTKIQLGASLVQLITGLIYQGPQVVGSINAELAALAASDGYSSISQAVGTHHKK